MSNPTEAELIRQANNNRIATKTREYAITRMTSVKDLEIFANSENLHFRLRKAASDRLAELNGTTPPTAA